MRILLINQYYLPDTAATGQLLADVAALAEALRGFAADPAGRAEMGRRGRLYYERHFGRDRSVARIVAAIEGRPDPITED